MLNRILMGLSVLVLVASLAVVGCTKDQAPAADTGAAVTDPAAVPTDTGAPVEDAPVEGSTEQPAQ